MLTRWRARLGMFCHHSFCRVCIVASLKQRKSCPHDRKFLSERGLVPNRAVNDHLNKLTVRCTGAATLTGAAADAACDWTGALSALQQHLESACPMEDVTCKWAGCGAVLARRHIAAHEQDACGFRLLTCPHSGCGSTMAAHSLEQHAADCSHAPMVCPNVGCGALLAHADVEGHLDVCPSVPMVCSVPGCGVNVTRGSMDAHLQANIGHHLALLNSRLEAAEAAAAAADSRARASERPRMLAFLLMSSAPPRLSLRRRLPTPSVPRWSADCFWWRASWLRTLRAQIQRRFRASATLMAAPKMCMLPPLADARLCTRVAARGSQGQCQCRA
jgi:hypothetical protein